MRWGFISVNQISNWNQDRSCGAETVPTKHFLVLTCAIWLIWMWSRLVQLFVVILPSSVFLSFRWRGASKIFAIYNMWHLRRHALNATIRTSSLFLTGQWIQSIVGVFSTLSRTPLFLPVQGWTEKSLVHLEGLPLWRCRVSAWQGWYAKSKSGADSEAIIVRLFLFCFGWSKVGVPSKMS